MGLRDPVSGIVSSRASAASDLSAVTRLSPSAGGWNRLAIGGPDEATESGTSRTKETRAGPSSIVLSVNDALAQDISSELAAFFNEVGDTPLKRVPLPSDEAHRWEPLLTPPLRAHVLLPDTPETSVASDPSDRDSPPKHSHLRSSGPREGKKRPGVLNLDGSSRRRAGVGAVEVHRPMTPISPPSSAGILWPLRLEAYLSSGSIFTCFVGSVEGTDTRLVVRLTDQIQPAMNEYKIYQRLREADLEGSLTPNYVGLYHSLNCSKVYFVSVVEHAGGGLDTRHAYWTNLDDRDRSVALPPNMVLEVR